MKMIFVVIAALVGVAANAYGASAEVDGVVWYYNVKADGTAEITYNKNAHQPYERYKGDLIIPKVIDGHDVSAIGYKAFEQASLLSSIKLQGGVTSIGDFAFDGCSKLSEVSLPNGLVDIGGWAFRSCVELGSVAIPSSVTNIGNWAFYRCNGMNTILVYSANENYRSSDGILYDKSGGILICCPGNKSGDVKVLEGVKEVLGDSFYQCAKLTNVNLPFGVTNIGVNAFYGCSNLQGMTLPYGVTAIGECAFAHCVSLASFAIPPTVREIDEVAFFDCPCLKTVIVGKGDVERVKSLLANSGLDVSSLTFEEAQMDRFVDVGYQGNDALSWFDAETGYTYYYDKEIFNTRNEVVISNPNSVITEMGYKSTSFFCAISPSPAGKLSIPSKIAGCPVVGIYKGAFNGCDRLKDVVIPEGVREMSDHCFWGMKELVSASLPSTIANVGEGVFAESPKLEKVIFGDGMSIIGSQMFYLCRSLKNVVIPGSVMKVADKSFYGCDMLDTVEIRDGVRELGKQAFAECEKLVSVKLPDSITNVCALAFFSCSSLDSITLPKNLTVIERSSFNACGSLKSVVIQRGVEKIDEFAFGSCYALEEVTIPSSVKTISDYSFYGCSSLKSIGIPRGAEKIGEFAFASCYALEEATIPSTVKTIGREAFDLCKSLQTIFVDKGDCDRMRSCMSSAGVDVGSITFVEVCSDVVVPSDATGGVEIKVEGEWFGRYPSFAAVYGTDLASAVLKPNGKIDAQGNAMYVWEDYVAGTNPTDPDDVFTASLTIVDGKPVISWSPELDDARKALRKYTTWGKVKLTDKDWSVVGEGEEGNFNFFKVTVEMR